MKGKMNTKTILIIIALLAVFAVIAPELMAISGSGYTVNSVSVDTPIITENTNLKNVNYIISTTFNGRGQFITAKITPSDIEQKSGYRSMYDFDIKVDAIDEEITYPIRNTGNKIIQFSRGTAKPGQCAGTPIYTFKYYGGFFGLHQNDICVYESIDAIQGDLGEPFVGNSAKITVSSKNGAESYSKTINTNTTQDVFFNDPRGNQIVSAHWVGSLASGQFPPYGRNYVVTYAKPENYWTLSTRDEYDAYTRAESVFRGNMRSWLATNVPCTGLADCEDKIGGEISIVENARRDLVGGTAPRIGSAQTYIDRSKESGGEIRITLTDKQINRMIVNFNVNADWIGIVIPTGQPDILSVDCPSFASGDSSGVCSLNIKNIGTASGTFTASMSPCGVFSQSGNTIPRTFTKGEIDSMNVYVGHGLAATTTSQTCTFTVTDTNSGAKDTIQGTISMTEPKACVAGSIRKSGDIVYQCNADGTGEDIILACGASENILLGDDGKWFCKEKAVGGIGGVGDILNDINDFFNEYGVMLSILFIVMGVIALMLVFLIVKMYIKNLLGIR